MAAAELLKTVLFNNTNLKAYYRFESGALTTDSSGQGKTLTNNNTATETTGKYGGGVAFNGTNQSLTIAENFGIGTTNWTLSVWAKPSSSSQLRGVVALGNGGSNGVSIYQGNGSGSAGNKIDGHLHGVVWLPSGVDWTGTDFNHVVMTRDTTTTRIYVNGVHRNSTTATPGAPNNVFEIGKMNTLGWAGSVDEVAIFSTALSADQIKELYEGRFLGEAWPQAGLVAGYHLNGSSTDFSGNNNHGTDTAITYSQANGKFGKGAGFNGSSSKINLGSIMDFDKNLTISFWVKINSISDFCCFFSKNTWMTKFAILYIPNSFRVYNNGGVVLNISTTLALNVWHNIVLTYNGTTIIVYINGRLSGSTSYSTSITDSGNFILGVSEAEPTYWLNGSMDEFLIFNRALTAQEIRRRYALGTGKLQ